MNEVKDTLTIADTSGKVLFIGIDGTLSPTRLKSHVRLNGEEYDDSFVNRTPSKFMQNLINTCNAKKVISISHCASDEDIQNKRVWLSYYYPTINDSIFISPDVSKADKILNYCNEHELYILQDILFIDDYIPALLEAERKKIPACHLSNLLDWLC